MQVAVLEIDFIAMVAADCCYLVGEGMDYHACFHHLPGFTSACEQRVHAGRELLTVSGEG